MGNERGRRGGLLPITFVIIAALPLAAQDRLRNRDAEEAALAFLHQERDVWELESRLLHEALEAIANLDPKVRNELACRKAIRQGRSAATLRKVREFIEEHLQPESRELLRDIGEANGTKPEEVFADYLTVEATVDFALMASAYNTVHGNNFDKFPNDAKRLLRNLVENLRKPPVPSNAIEVGRVRGDRLIVNVFGCEIIEDVTAVDVNRRTAQLTWRSNYSFLRDLKDRCDPQESREETLLLEDGRWTVSYAKELEEFVDATGRTEWGKKVRELVNIDGYLSKRDPLDTNKARRTRFVYDPEVDDVIPTKFTREEERDDDRDRRRRFD